MHAELTFCYTQHCQLSLFGRVLQNCRLDKWKRRDFWTRDDVAAAVHASPLTKRQDNKVPDVWENKDTLCKGWVLSTPEEADRLWMETKAGNQLEHQNNWLINLEDRVFGGTDGKSGAAGCSVLDNDCSPMNNIECTEQYEKYGTDDSLNKTSYWIFQAAKGMHSKFKALKTKITEKTIISGLRIGQMVTDFGSNEDDTGDMVGFAVGFNILGGIFSSFGNLKQEVIDQGTISAGLADLFEAAVDRLDETMRIVMGGGTEDQYNALKTPNPDPYKKPVANFFNGSFFLLNDNVEAV
ncbi:hypothetical protein BFJ68_g9603 [Fusarium oxysporum]|uniref:Uncharacterized protein n=1 Tax=Fusarium oxysporum TaxID=5507 RepID=A0A420QU24_FUSOX|nr:hypothetical protein BFJ68_g9603 [Fusarium oxysporum]